MPRQTYSAFAKELAKQDKEMARRFLERVSQITAQAQVALIDAAIEARDFDRLFDLLQLDAASWSPLDLQIQQAFIQGALWQQSFFGPSATRLRIGFNHRNPRAERWYMQRGADFVREITEDQLTMVRTVILEGLEQGRGTRAMRRDLIGEKQGTRRVGGLVGLHSREAAAVQRMRGYLSDPETMAEYFERTARDRRFDKTVSKAIREGKRLSAKKVRQISAAYAQRLLVKRSDRIARTEMHNAFSAGMFEGMAQTVEDNDIPADAITLRWQATVGSVRTRDTHRELNDETVTFGQPFRSPSGALMKYPGDKSLGAPGAETINCFPPWQRVLRAGVTHGVRSDYTGKLVELTGSGMVNLTVTPNHPVLTLTGWKPAHLLSKGDQVIQAFPSYLGVVSSGQNVANAYASAEELYNSGQISRSVVGPVSVVMDFHGEAGHKNVNVVSIPSSLGRAFDVVFPEEAQDFVFSGADIAEGRLLASRMFQLSDAVATANAHRLVSRLSATLPGFWGGEGRGSPIPLRDIRLLNAKIAEASVDERAAIANALGDGVDSVAFVEKALHLIQVSLSDFRPVALSGVRHVDYSGPVFNFESKTKVLVSGGIVNHNCRCSIVPRIDFVRLAR